METTTLLARGLTENDRKLIADAEILQVKGLYKPVHFEVINKHVYPEPRPVARFTLSPLPGCCGVVVSSNSFRLNNDVWMDGAEFHLLKEKVARHFNYGAMLATTQCINFPEVIGAAKAGWRLEHPFRNPRTKRDISFMIKILHKPE